MSQNPEERLLEEGAPSASARVVPFERPQSELQKAVQQRAQETIDRQRDRAAAQRPPVWRRALILMLAVIPVVLTFGAAFQFVAALRQFHAAIFQAEAAAESASEATSAQPAPSSEPDVVLLQPYAVPSAPAQDERTSTESPAR